MNRDYKGLDEDDLRTIIEELDQTVASLKVDVEGFRSMCQSHTEKIEALTKQKEQFYRDFEIQKNECGVLWRVLMIQAGRHP